jgi:endonuclease-3 related protein
LKIDISNSCDLLIFLKDLDLLKNSPKFWWPEFGTFKVVIGAILTQNTKWTNVEKSLSNLSNFIQKDCDDDIIAVISKIDTLILSNLITPSGFKNQKAPRLKLLCQNILNDFETFENFQKQVSRKWLLKQKGIGPESADAILCYACQKDSMVVDSYTKKLLENYGYEFETYDDIKDWLEFGINENYDKIIQNYGFDITLNEIYARFHGKIVEYMKKKDG